MVGLQHLFGRCSGPEGPSAYRRHNAASHGNTDPNNGWDIPPGTGGVEQVVWEHGAIYFRESHNNTAIGVSHRNSEPRGRGEGAVRSDGVIRDPKGDKHFDFAYVNDIKRHPKDSGSPAHIRNHAHAQKCIYYQNAISKHDNPKPKLFALILGTTGQFADNTYPEFDTLARHLATSKLRRHRFDRTCTFASLLQYARQRLAYALVFPILKTYRDRYRANARCDVELEKDAFYASLEAEPDDRNDCIPNGEEETDMEIEC